MRNRFSRIRIFDAADCWPLCSQMDNIHTNTRTRAHTTTTYDIDNIHKYRQETAVPPLMRFIWNRVAETIQTPMRVLFCIGIMNITW